MSQIFISYARKDHFFVDRLREDLVQAGINYWIDHEDLSPGTASWEKAIRAALKNCDSVLWIVSPESFKSAYVRDEISIARLYKLKIYPIFADGENWLECVPLGTGEIQYIDARTNYQAAMKMILKELATSTSGYHLVDPEIPSLPSNTDPRNPYKGLSAFTEKDVSDFYGREALVDKLNSKLNYMIEHKADRFLAVMGASGAGKSSVVMAGLLPSLRKSHENWTILPKIVPGTHPVEALADSLYSAMPDKSLSAIETDLNSPGGRMLHRLANQIEGEQVILYIDQFEELFTLTDDEDERHQFINLITQAVTEPDGKVIVIMSMRADFYGHPANYPELGRLVNQNNELVLPMTISELRDSIEKPARLPDVALTFDDGLVAEIIFALRGRDKALAGALPLLQFTLERLFEERDGTHLTWETYNQLGNPEEGISGVEGAIGTHCEAVFSKLPEEVQTKLSQVFLPLVNIDETTGEATRRRVLQSAVIIDDESELFVNRFIDNRLLQTGHEGDSVYIEITHEALFRSWGRLANWLDETKDELQFLQQVRLAAKEWEDNNRHESFLWGDSRLKVMTELASIRSFDGLVQEFCSESQKYDRKQKNYAQVPRALTDVTNYDDLLDVFVKYVADEYVQQIYILVFIEGHQEALEFVAGITHSEIDLSGVRVASDMFPVYSLMLPAQLLHIHDIFDPSYNLTELETTSLDSLGARSFVVFPLRGYDRTIGSVFMVSSRSIPYSPSDLETFASIAEQASLTLRGTNLLEQSEERATQIETSIVISQSIAQIIDLDVILPQIVDLIKEQFSYDHVQIFMMDIDKEWAELKVGTGEAGEKLVANKHKLKRGSQSVIGQVTQSGKPYIAVDAADANVIHRPNPYLPLTRSELAIPLIAMGDIIGALDVQSNKPDNFSENEVQVLSGLAAQITNAVILHQYREQTDASLTEKIEKIEKLTRNIVDLLEQSIQGGTSQVNQTDFTLLLDYTQQLSDLREADYDDTPD